MFDIYRYQKTKATKVYTFSADGQMVSYDVYDPFTGEKRTESVSTSRGRYIRERNRLIEQRRWINEQLDIINEYLDDINAAVTAAQGG